MGGSAVPGLLPDLEHTGSPARTGLGCALKMGRGSPNWLGRPSSAIRQTWWHAKAASARLAAGNVPSMTIVHGF